jgi:bacteriocin-like protein
MFKHDVSKAIDVVRALKDANYRETLSADARKGLGSLMDQRELTEQELAQVSGGGFIMKDTVIIPRR